MNSLNSLKLPPLIETLLNPEVYHPTPPAYVELRQTHISYLFFTPDRVYKIKKPVNFGFLNFTTLAKRKHFCHQEVILNRRLCPEVYLGVVEIKHKDRRKRQNSGLCSRDEEASR